MMMFIISAETVKRHEEQLLHEWHAGQALTIHVDGSM